MGSRRWSPSIRLFAILTVILTIGHARAEALPYREIAQAPADARPSLRAGSLGGHPSPSRGSIVGTVTDPEGRPIPDADVLITQAATITARARTDASGEFRVTSLADGQYRVLVALEGFRADPQPVTLSGGDAPPLTVRLTLSAVSESVVVSASQTDVPLSLVAESASVLTGRDLAARQLDTVSDALRLVPGLSVSQNGGRGTVTSVFARGGESDYSLVLINGIRANAFGGGFDFSQLPVANIERVEVVRGPGSALFGSDAMGSVVQIVTRQGGQPRADASIEGGSFGTMRGTASTSGSHGRWNWGGAAERVASDGFTGTAPATGERVSNDDYRSHQLTATAGWHGAGGTEVALNGGWIWSDRGFPGPFGSNPIGLFTAVDRVSRGVTDTREAGLSVVAPIAGGRVRQHAQVSWFDLANDFTSLYGLSSSGTRRLAGRLQTDVAISGSTRLSAGVDLQHEQADSNFITAGSASSPVPIVRTLVGVFAEARYEHGGRLTLSGGLRGEQVARDALEGSPNPYTPRPPFPADTARALDPKASASYLLYQRVGGAASPLSIAWLRIRGSAGTGMRAPDALEIAFTDNPHLKPERSRSVEAGIESGLANGRAVVEATWFANRYDDMIVAVGPAMVDASRYRTDNIANARAGGLELSARFRTPWGLEAHVAYTWLDTAVLGVDNASGEAPPPFHVGDALLRRPRHQGALDLVYARGRLTLYSAVGARSHTLDVEPTYGAFGGLFWNPGFATVRCGGSWRLLSALELVARVDNAFDAHYEETYGFPAPGRAFMLGVRVAAGR